MKLGGKVVVVTGGASGIGLALARRFVAEGARVVTSDRNEELGARQASEIGARFVPANVAEEEDVRALVQSVLDTEGRIDLFCANAGIAIGTDETTENRHWQRIHDVNVMSHVYAARHVLPHMIERGEGYFLTTASAAGLLTEVNSAPYAVTKHAALAFAEWLSIAHHDEGIRVSCLCPEGVWTPMIENARNLQKTAIPPEDVAEAVVQALGEERFLITTHPTTLPGFQMKAQDYEEWLTRMRRYRQKAVAMRSEVESPA